MSTLKNIIAKELANKVKEIFKNKNYAFFDGNLSYNLNIVGIRSANTKVNNFDDNILVIYRNDNKDWEVLCGAATTDPGLTPLLRPQNSSGTAILVPGQYRGSHKIDLHAGKYLALRQSGAKVKVYRDNNRDKKHDMRKGTIEEGFFGINIHRASKWKESKLVNSYSAGCQVFQSPKDFNRFLSLCQKSAEKFGNGFSYTLLEEKDFK